MTHDPAKSPVALIDHILQRYHAEHRADLAALLPLARKVETVHGDQEDAPHGVTDLLSALATDLEQHMAKEEQVLFPLMRQGGHPMISQPIAVMRQDHAEAEALTEKLRLLTRDFTPPAGACGSWRGLYAGIEKLVSDLKEHMILENDVLFPAFAPVA